MQNQKHLDVQRRGFSLVEIALALGVIAFALLSVVALLSTGVKSNEISVEETRATAILTLLEADLRNTSPAYNSTSAIYHLPLPYAANPTTSASIFNPALQVNTLYTAGLSEAEQPLDFSTNPRTRFQCSVIYTQIPAAGFLTPIRARLIVNWPGEAAFTMTDLTNRTKADGFVEAAVSFRAP